MSMKQPIPCTGIGCNVERNCPGGAKTTVTGTVYAPNGTLPLYNATVYVPVDVPEAFTAGVTCDRCDGKVSGNPVAIAGTDATGTFKLTDVPSGDGIPLVIQIGRWRRQVTIPKVQACVTTTITDVDLLRLPKTQDEGDMPQMAIASGGSDPFECLLRKIGIADSEFTGPSKTGKVHFYKENGVDTVPAAPAASTMWGSMDTLTKYDIVILPCEGDANAKPDAGHANLVQYLNAGGRVFTTHYSYVWLSYPGSPYATVGGWHLDQNYPDDPTVGKINTSFPKGMAFADWLHNVDPSVMGGLLSVNQPRHDIDSVNMTYAQEWISAPGMTLHMTFNTPLMPPPDPDGTPAYCGKVVYSDFHVSTSDVSIGQTFPASCKISDFTAQEKALAFMLFDLSSCVQKDSDPPIP